MSLLQQSRHQIAADLLRVKVEKDEPLEDAVNRRVRAMSNDERGALTVRINGVRTWVTAYEAAEKAFK